MRRRNYFESDVKKYHADSFVVVVVVNSKACINVAQLLFSWYTLNSVTAVQTLDIIFYGKLLEFNWLENVSTLAVWLGIQRRTENRGRDCVHKSNTSILVQKPIPNILIISTHQLELHNLNFHMLISEDFRLKYEWNKSNTYYVCVCAFEIFLTSNTHSETQTQVSNFYLIFLSNWKWFVFVFLPGSVHKRYNQCYRQICSMNVESISFTLLLLYKVCRIAHIIQKNIFNFAHGFLITVLLYINYIIN